MVQIVQTTDGGFSTAKFIVAKSAAEGTHTTISSALLDASVGDTVFVKSGTYTENLNLLANINLAAFPGNSFGANSVTIVGKMHLTEPGDLSISGVSLKTSGDYFLLIEGTAAGTVTINNCYLDCADNTGISITAGNTKLICNNCKGDLLILGITYALIDSSSSSLEFVRCTLKNTGLSITPMRSENGLITLNFTHMESPVHVLNNSKLNIFKSSISTTRIGGPGVAHTAFSTDITAIANATDSYFDGGAEPAIIINGASRVRLDGMNTVQSNHASTIAGSGTLEYAPACFPDLGNNATMNVATRIVTPIGRDVIVSGTINAFIGGTHALSMTEEGEFTYPLHPAFSALLNTHRLDVTGTGTIYKIILDTVVFDQGGDFDLVTGEFTAPVTGKYRLNARATIKDGVDMNFIGFYLVTSNRAYGTRFSIPSGSSMEIYTSQINQLCDMDAGDTAYMQIASEGELTNINSVYGNANNFTTFSGTLEA